MAETVYCSFCTRASDDVGRLVAGPGVHICADCVALCVDVLAAARQADEARATEVRDTEVGDTEVRETEVRETDGADRPRVPVWESMTDEQVLEHLPRIAKVAGQVEDSLRGFVGLARARDITWARIGDSLGMTRQSAWERFTPAPKQDNQHR
jgi:hypothetical protein